MPLPFDRAVLFDALRLVRRARVELSVPLAPGSLFPGLAIKDGTVLRTKVDVRDGEIDLPNAEVELLPALDGPLFTRVKGVRFGDDHRLSLRITGFPDVKLGPPIPSKMDALATWLQEGGPESVKVRMFGVKLGAVKTDRVADMAPSPRELLGNPQQPGAPLLEQARVSVEDVELAEGVLLLGELGRVRVECDAGGRLELEAGEVRLEAELHYSDLQLHHGEWRLEDGAGKGKLFVNARGLRGAPSVNARLEELQLRTGAASVCPQRGDVLALDYSEVRGGSVEVGWTLNAPPTLRANLPDAEGTMSKGRVTLRIEGQPTTVEVRDSSWRGSFLLDGEELRITGDVTLHSRVSQFRPTAEAVSLDLYDATLDGDAEIELDLQNGAQLRGRGLTGRTNIREARARGWGDRVKVEVADDSSAEMELTSLSLDPHGHLQVEGRGELALRLHRMEVVHERAKLEGSGARMDGSAVVRLDTREGIELSDATMSMQAAHWGLEGRLPNGFAARADGSYGMQLGHAFVDVEPDKFELDEVRDGHVRADIQRGWLELPGGKRIRLRKGSQLRFELRDADIGTEKGLRLAGPMTLEARLEADDDLIAAIHLAGLELGEFRADQHRLTVKLDGLTLAPDGQFLVSNVRVAVISDMQTVSGRLVLDELQ